MADPRFFESSGPFALADIATAVGAQLDPGADASMRVADIAPLDAAGPLELSFLDNPKYITSFGRTRAGACIIGHRHRMRAPEAVSLLLSDDPYRAFAEAAHLFYPGAATALTLTPSSAEGPSHAIDPSAKLGAGVVIESGAVIGAKAEIGDGTVIGPGTVIGKGVAIGRGSWIGPNVTIAYALLGDEVVVHAGARIGQEGFGFARGETGHVKVPQLGRVIIQDRVEIGANVTVDRGSGPDTVIGEGTKIDNLVQVAHNVQIGRHCLIAAECGISGSTIIGDHVAMGGQVGIIGHLHIGDGAQFAAGSLVLQDVPARGEYGGYPAKPKWAWLRESVTLGRLAKRRGNEE